MRCFLVPLVDVIKSKRYIETLENSIRAFSNHYNLMHKHTTGFGWYNNLQVLQSNQLISLELAEIIEETHDFFNNLSSKQNTSINIWNRYVGMQHNIVKTFELN